MQVPSSVNILGVIYQVKQKDLEDENGYISPKKLEIGISSDLYGSKLEQVFLHEVIHGILDQLGYGELYSDEKLVQGLAVGLQQALAD